MKRKIPKDLVSLVKKFDKKQILMGLKIESEHDKGNTDVVKSWVDILKIALAHLKEDPNYYDHLKKMEDQYATNESTNRILKLSGLLTETTLSRIYSHFKNESTPVAIISAFRGEYNHNQNVSRQSQLMSMVRSMGYGYIKASGHWIENKGTSEEFDSNEESLIVIGKPGDDRFESEIIKLIKKFEQEGALYKPIGTTKVCILSSTGHRTCLGQFRPKILGPGYTKLKGRGERTFTFDDSVIDKS